MAWNAGNITLNPGESLTVYYSWSDDHGVQFVQPLQLLSNIPPPIVVNSLRVSAYGTTRNSDGLTVTYFINVTNDGPGVSNFTIIGFGDQKTGVA